MICIVYHIIGKLVLLLMDLVKTNHANIIQDPTQLIRESSIRLDEI
jgi:hypothetical protein